MILAQLGLFEVVCYDTAINQIVACTALCDLLTLMCSQPAGLGSARAGLGANPRAGGNDEGDMYSSYRSSRSGVYHENIIRGVAQSNTARGGR